LGEEEV